MMQSFFEVLMLICFGLSWPISVYKSFISGSCKGKSCAFTVAILIGYIAGIAGKIAGQMINYVFILYIINIIMVSADLVLYFINRKREKEYSMSL